MTEGMPPGNKAIVDEAVDDAAQTLFTAADGGSASGQSPGLVELIPLARTDELRAAIQGPAVRAVLEMRVEQMVKHGHTLEADLDLPLHWLVQDARIRLQSAFDLIYAPERRNLPRARRALVRALAVGLAAIDVLDATMNAEAQPVQGTGETGVEAK